MKRTLLSVLQFLLFLCIGILLLWLVFRKIDLGLIVDELRQINYFWITLCFISGIISHVSRAVRWNLLINTMGHKTSNLRTFYAVMIGYLANLAIPRIGEVTRCGVVSKTEKIPVNALIGTVISERVFDMVVLFLITFLVIIFQLDLVGSFVTRYLVSPLFLKFEGNKMQMFFFLGTLALLLLGLIILLRKLRPVIRHFRLYQKMVTMINGFWDGILSIKRMQHKGRFLFWTLMIWGNYFLMTYLCFFALQATSHLTIIDGLTVLALGSFGIVAPVPGGIGAYHFIVKAILFELYHIQPVAAVSFATISHFAQTLILLVGGVISYLLIVIYLKRKTHEEAGAPAT